jgi:hypothetical protein
MIFHILAIGNAVGSIILMFMNEWEKATYFLVLAGVASNHAHHLESHDPH